MQYALLIASTTQGHADSHVWDGDEVLYNQRWEVETHRDHREFKKQHSDKQKDN
jgi:hypothetical protein